MCRKKELLQELYAMEKAGDYPVSTPEDVAVKLLPYRNKKTEIFVVLAMDNKNNIMAKKEFKGTVDQSAIYPREVMRFALLKQASGIILSHNHPGGDPAPSRQDKEVTQQIQRAGHVLGVRVLDHIIMSRAGHYSFQENNLMN